MEPALRAQGLTRQDVRIGNALLCRPPDQDLEKILVETARENKRRVAHNVALAAGEGAVSGELLPPVPTPQECCRPQLVQTVLSAPDVLVMGATPWQSLTGERRSMVDIRGAFIERHITPAGLVLRPVEIPGGGGFVPPPPGAVRLRLTPTWNPAFVLRAPQWAKVFSHDVERWVRWTRGELSWVPGKLVRNPSFAYLERFLYSPHTTAYLPAHTRTVDIETDGIDDLSTKMRCIGFSDGEWAFIVHFRSIRAPYKLLGDEPEVRQGLALGWYDPHEAAAIRGLIRRYLLDPTQRKIGHNFGYFDTSVLLRELELPDIHNVRDSILQFRSTNTELPRGLYTLGTMTTHVADWKATNDDLAMAEGARTDEDLGAYCGTDVVVNARAMPMLTMNVARRRQEHLIQLDLGVQRQCMNMHWIGMRVDQAKRKKLEDEYVQRVDERRDHITDVVGIKNFNVASVQQLGKLLYQDWKLPVLSWTDSYEPSTSDDVLREIIIKRLGTDQMREVVQLIRVHRTDTKRLAGVILPFRMHNDLRVGSDGKLVGGLCRADGRIHPHYNSHTPATGRISSSSPNSQNVEKFLRALLIPEDGHIFVGADYDQIELRLISGVAGVQSYINVFNAGGDPHAVTAKLVYGDVFEKLYTSSLCPKCLARYRADGIMRKMDDDCDHPSNQYNNLRNFAKTFVYAVIYGATPETLYANLASAENRDGTLAFPNMTLAMVIGYHNAWMAGAKEIPAYWEKLIQQGLSHGYVTEPIGGRVRDCYDVLRQGRNQVLNFPIQGGASIITGKAVLRAVARIPHDFKARTGLVNYMHDAVTFEVPERFGRDAVAILDEVLPARETATPAILYSAKAKLAATLKDAA